MLEGGALDPRDVARVRDVTAQQWRTANTRSPHHADAYWAGAGDADGASVARRRSEWLAALPAFAGAGSAIELGCNVGRNLWVLQQRFPAMALCGVDIDAEALAQARARVRAEFVLGDLYDLEATLGERSADIVFTMGTLIHLHPDTLPPLLAALVRRARRAVVLVEQVNADNAVVKGPASWHPERRVTGDYIQWSPDLPGMLTRLGVPHSVSDVPPDLQSNGARHLLVVPVAREGA